MTRHVIIPLHQWGCAGMAAVVGVLLLALFVILAEPTDRQPGNTFTATYDEQPLLDMLTEEGLREQMARIHAAGSPPDARAQGRYTGSPGFYRTEALITEAFRQAGLRMITQEFQVVVPETEECALVDEHGRELPGVTLYPFEPCGLIPTALPPEGISGTLVVTESSGPLDLVGKPLEGNIVLNDGLDNSWPMMASLGAKAVLFKESPSDTPGDPDSSAPWARMINVHDVSFPYFLVRGPIEAHAGKPLRIHARVRWKSRPVRNVIGILSPEGDALALAEEGRREALLLTAYYDSHSVVPELAPGAEQAIGLAALLEYARALAPYRRELKRDIVFIAVAGHTQSLVGLGRIQEAIEEFSGDFGKYYTLEAQRDDNQRLLGYARQALEIVEDNTPWRTGQGDAYRARWLRRDAGFRQWFERCFATVAGEVDLERREDVLAARLDWIRQGLPTFRDGFNPETASNEERKDAENRHPLLARYLEAKAVETQAGTVISMPFWTVAERLSGTEYFAQWQYRERLRAYLLELIDHHRQRGKELEDSLAVRKVFRRYGKTLTVNLEFNSGGHGGSHDLAILMGRTSPGTVVEPQSTDLKNAITEKVPVDGDTPLFGVTSWGTRDATGGLNDPNIHSRWNTELETVMWFQCARLAFTVINKGFYPPKVGTPEDTFEGLPAFTVANDHIRATGRALLTVGCGRIGFKRLAYATRINPMTIVGGTVYTMAGVSPMPEHPVGRDTFVHIYRYGELWLQTPTRGIKRFPILQTDPYGNYRRTFIFTLAQYGSPVSVDAARFAPDGTLAYYKDASPLSQSIFKNEQVPGRTLNIGNEQPINLSLFRCAPVACFQRVNPKTLNSFARFEFLTSPGFQQPEFQHVKSNMEAPAYYAFLPPDCTFYVAMLDGSAANPEVQTYRAFMLNVDSPRPPAEPGGEPREPELHGRGYLAADTPNLAFPYFDTAASMLRTNAKRLQLQTRYRIADRQMLESHERSLALLREAEEHRAAGEPVLAVNAAGRSLAHAINNHPVVRKKISDAIVGILWYLVLLVPFVFFMEKLLFGFSDIRKQLLTAGAFFVVVFALLQQFHPAFQMVRSPLMILLGFLILLLAVLVSLMVIGKFQQTARAFRRREGYVEGADINRSGVIGTAVVLGLNNMRKRKVRTGLTCVTLVFISFVMICFASVSTDLVETEYATGSSPANGIFRRDPNFAPLREEEVANIRQIYGLQYPVTTRMWTTGILSQLTFKNPEILLDRKVVIGEQTVTRRATASGAIIMQWNEPEFSGIDRYLLTNRGWFPRPPSTTREYELAKQQGYTPRNYLILPDRIAEALNLSVEEVNDGHPTVRIRGKEYEVLGIFDSARLTNLIGMDGQSILPYDLNSVQRLGRSKTGAMIVPQNIGRLRGEEVIIANVPPPTPPPGQNTDQNFTVSCSVLFPATEYRLRPDLPGRPPVSIGEQRALVSEYLERVGVQSYYAVDGVAAVGERTRAKTVTGLQDLLIPLLIAALTVFNTMRGSVYERKDEIYVYNAVGIAPNHIFFMFMAEACVYAVIGAMGGYLLAQVTGTVLTVTGNTGGLNMDYSAIETIYVSITIVAAVLLSTLVPARMAARLALPSDEMSWSVPVAEGDRMQFNLPFTFTAHDRVAVISYFHRWFDANGQGSAGPFFCAPPMPVLLANAKEAHGVIPGIATTAWLRPFDLGVSQRILITLPTDPETGEFIATIAIHQLSGTTAAWQRTIMPFLVTLRKQFLHWRAVSPAERAEMFAEARDLLDGARREEEVPVA